MRYVLSLFVLAIFVFALVPNASAQTTQSLEIEFNPSEISTFSGKDVFYKLTIHNNRDEDDSFLTRVSGPKLYWLTQPVLLLPVNASASRGFNIIAYPNEEIAGSFQYAVTVSSYTHPEISRTAAFTLEILPPLIMNSFSGNLNGREVETEMELVTGKEMEVDIEYEIVDSKGVLVKKESVKETVNGVTPISKSILLPENMLAGDYITKVLVNNELTDSFVFSINPVHNIVERVERISSPLAEEITIRLTNEGNVIEKNYRIKKTTPSSTLTGFITSPEECSIEGSDRKCSYVIDSLGLDETKEIRYRLEFYPTYIQIALSILIVAGIVMYSFRSVTKPKITKRHKKKTKNTHSVIIEIRNPFYHNLKNVIVRDWVTPLARVVEEFEHMTPVIRKSEAGTELIWKLGDMKPKETRLINYNLRTLVGGSLKMPKARIRFKTPNGKKWKVNSNYLVIE